MLKLNLTDTLGRSTPVLRNRIFLGLSTAFVVGTRLLTLNGQLTNPESVNFALALHHFDVAAQSPPLPGYPVYIFLAKLFSFLGLSDATALAMPGILSAAFGVYPLYHLVKRLHGEADARLAVLLYILNPGLWILSLRPSYAALLLFPFLLALRMFVRIVLLPRHLKHQTRFLSFYTGTLALGILCGITLDTLFLFIPLLLFTFYGLFKLKRTRIMIEMANGIIVGLCLWAVPFFFTVSIADLIARPETGEIPFASAAPLAMGFLGKLKLFFWDILSFGFLDNAPSALMLAPAAILACALFLAVRHMRLEYKYFFLLTFFLPYVLFLLLYRNLYLPGNIVLLIPMVIVFVSAGLATLGKKPFLLISACLILFSFAFGWHRAYAYRHSSAPGVRMAEYLKTEADAGNTVLFGNSTVRILRYYAPDLRCYAIASTNELQKPLYRKIMKDRKVYLVSDIPGLAGIDGALSAKAVYPPQPYLFGQSEPLTLYVWSPADATP